MEGGCALVELFWGWRPIANPSELCAVAGSKIVGCPALWPPGLARYVPRYLPTDCASRAHRS